jgi:hypothetical protein
VADLVQCRVVEARVVGYREHFARAAITAQRRTLRRRAA